VSGRAVWLSPTLTDDARYISKSEKSPRLDGSCQWKAGQTLIRHGILQFLLKVNWMADLFIQTVIFSKTYMQLKLVELGV
jgi:hypothetical protein